MLPVLALPACRSGSPPATRKPQLTVAAAANLTDVFQQLGPIFEKQTGIQPIFSFASTAQLARQIESAAPFDVFAAADSEHVDQLDHEGLLLPGSRAVYARGVLALWIPPGSRASIRRIQDLAQPAVRVIAMAKPDLAPYGQAAVETLQRLGIWNQVQPKIVYAENIGMARQYGMSHNADAVFTAYSLVLHEPGLALQVDENLHTPIDQELGIVRQSRHANEARKFVSFLETGAGRAILAAYGYRPPDAQSALPSP